MRAIFPQEPDPSAAAMSNDLGDVGGNMKDGDFGESRGPVTKKGAGGEGEGFTATRRKEALTAEFVARLEIDRASVERGIRARDNKLM